MKKFHFKINDVNYDWDEQFISGLKIRQLGEISSNSKLYLQQNGQNADKLVLDTDSINLSNPGIEKFYSKQVSYLIIVNTREETWLKDSISYDELIILAYQKPELNKAYTITYSQGPAENNEGVIVKSQSVYVTDNMIFNVTGTTQS